MTGLTAEGFEPKRLPATKAEIEARLIAAFGPIDLRAESVFGQLIGIAAELDALLWALADDVYQSQYPDTASGVPLDHVVSINGIVRQPATPTVVDGLITGTPGTVIPAGSEARSALTGDLYRTQLPGTIGAGGTVTVRFVAVDTGARVINAGDLTEIETPLAGWDTITNVAAGQVGRDRETDAELRIRRENSIQITATHTTEAILSRLLQTAGVLDARVLENNSDATDANGTPAHHIWAIVDGGATIDVATVIFNTIAGGIGMRGAVLQEVVSPTSGEVYAVRFDRPSFVEPTIQVTVAPGAPISADAEIKAAVEAFSATLEIGETLYLSRLFCPINDVPGVIVESLTVNGGIANVTVALNERVRLLGDNVAVTFT